MLHFKIILNKNILKRRLYLVLDITLNTINFAGFLVTEYLQQRTTADTYMSEVERKAKNYNPFNLCTFEKV